MKIILATYGSRGDVQPILALTLALQAEGHEVLLAAPPEKAAWARQLGCPFYPLGSDVTAFIDDNDIFFIQKYPHLKLFPKMAAVIHHGGAGTTATTAISGVPQIVVPHLLDQYYWGNQIFQTKLGPRPIWRSKLTSKKLAAAIRECLSNERFKQNAKKASDIIKQKDSLELTVSAIWESIT